MRTIVKLLLALVIFLALTACCIPMHYGHGSQEQDSDKNHDDRKQRDSGHTH